jgi:Recombinase/Resolvase, N terminal domain
MTARVTGSLMQDEILSVTRYAARSKTDEDANESTGSQIREIDAALAKLDGRTLAGEPHIDNASGSKSNRGPGLAAAIKEATADADRRGQAELWVHHSSRLGRGSGKPGGFRALGHLFYELQAAGVAVRSVTDDEFTTNEMLWSFASRQSAKYAEDLGAHVRRGYRQAAESGKATWIFRGIKLAGYHDLRSFEDGKVKITATKHPEDAWMYELIFGMAKAGHSAQAIQLELSSRGAMTRPVRKDHNARPFDVNRISQILDNPAYAGLLVHKGNVVGPGNWPRYIDPELPPPRGAPSSGERHEAPLGASTARLSTERTRDLRRMRSASARTDRPAATDRRRPPPPLHLPQSPQPPSRLRRMVPGAAARCGARRHDRARRDRLLADGCQHPPRAAERGPYRRDPADGTGRNEGARGGRRGRARGR